ncbi:MAG: serine hydrolase [Clostridium sp.]
MERKKVNKKIRKKMSKKEMMMRRTITIIVAVIIIVSGLGYVGKNIAASAEEKRLVEEKQRQVEEKQRQEEEARIRKEKEEELQVKIDEIIDSEHEKVVQAIESEVNGNNNYGVYYQDLVAGKVYEFNGTKDFIGASTVKVPLVIGVADLIQAGKLSPDDTVKFIQADYEGGTGILQGSEELNKPIKISRLIEVTITHSDNIATQMLQRVSTSITTVINTKTGINRKTGGNYINAKQLGILLKILYENKNNNPQYDVIIDHMKKTVFHDRLDKYVPYEIVAHKIGDNGGYAHDTGIIYTDRPYTLTVLTDGIGSETIAKMNKSVYDIKLETDSKIKELKTQYKNQYGIELK